MKKRFASFPLLRQRHEVFVADAEVERQVRTNFPIVLRKAHVIGRAEIALGVGGIASSRIGVYALEDRRIVGQIEQAAEGKDRARSARQITLLSCSLRTTTPNFRHGAGGLTQRIAEFKDVLRKDAWRASPWGRRRIGCAPLSASLRLRRAGCRNYVGGVRHLIDTESRRIESRFTFPISVDEKTRVYRNVPEELNGLRADQPSGDPAPPSGPKLLNLVRYVLKAKVSFSVGVEIEAQVVLIAAIPPRQRELYSLNIGDAVKPGRLSGSPERHIVRARRSMSRCQVHSPRRGSE